MTNEISNSKENIEEVVDYVETPCLNCPNMVTCKRMCYERLEWGILEANKDDEELGIYGNNLKVRKLDEIVKSIPKDKYEGFDEEVKRLLKNFEAIYKEVVINGVKNIK